MLFGSSENTVTGCVFGIELEVENQPAAYNKLIANERRPARYGAYWTLVHDGSLRNYGVEYVLSRPRTLDGCIEALHNIPNEPSSPRSYSVRTSVHVHMNVQDMTHDQVLALYALAGAVEPLMQRMVDPSRHTNLFCVPVHLCASAVSRFSEAYTVKGRREFVDILAGIGKYSSVNTGRLCDLGTFEFRAMHGTQDVTLLSDWLRVLSNLRELACSCTDVLQCIDILLWSEQRMSERLFAGCSAQYTGSAYCTYQEAVSASLSMLSAAKRSAHTSEGVEYQHVDGTLELVQYVATAHTEWRHCTRRDLARYHVPPVEVVLMVATFGADAMDCVFRDGYVYWFAVGQGGRLLCREMHSPKVTSTITLTFELEE